MTKTQHLPGFAAARQIKLQQQMIPEAIRLDFAGFAMSFVFAAIQSHSRLTDSGESLGDSNSTRERMKATISVRRWLTRAQIRVHRLL